MSIDQIEKIAHILIDIMAIISFFYILVSIRSKKAFLNNLNTEIFDFFSKSKEIADNEISKHFEQVELRTVHFLDDLQKIVENKMQNTTSRIMDLYEKIDNLQKSLISSTKQLHELEKINTELHKKIKKRDSIINRQAKKIEMMKKEKQCILE